MTDTVANPPSISRKTRFVDLPADVQRVLESIERAKQVQLQIGSSLVADETETQVQQISRAIQRLGQELQVVRMTLGGDAERVDDAKALVAFGVKHAERAASLVAHATDDGSWALSGLTPLQVAARQKALQALQHHHSSGQISSDQITPPAADSSAVDPFEAVRRIQFASMHVDVASDYYWTWLTRAEAAAHVLAERFDQLERFVAQQPSSSSGRPEPRAVADVMQCQNDS
ncbi:hypothetical protein GGI04_004711, partial [Coemansia thaxteri]